MPAAEPSNEVLAVKLDALHEPFAGIEGKLDRALAQQAAAGETLR